ncbi:hypothetical protein OSH11_18860 [Kaistia dalseonensis]|uniref:Uncharacterized protein n=1 Tax=Kaistia dalseonensis TaxID=410840 RepID=A0ABU0HAQ5_9HYPH|nr:hypothetical protein [Kaistia dalseonensis]MCX5496775.1 hypothetical protein [Kaistia dalseonensis]MDQ0439400.1 hypothetical protein [Kaistia dalseonensis]
MEKLSCHAEIRIGSEKGRQIRMISPGRKPRLSAMRLEMFGLAAGMTPAPIE